MLWAGALQLFRFDFGAPQHLEGLPGMHGCAGMGGARDGQTPLAALALIGGATGDKHCGLKGLEGRAHKAELLGIASAHQDPAAAITNGGVHPVA